MNTSRRLVLRNAVVVAPVLALLTGCAWLKGKTAQQITQAVLSDIALVASGLVNVLPQLSAIVGVPPSVAAIIADIKAVSGQLSANMTTTQAQPLVARIASDVQTLVQALIGIPLPPAVSSALKAVQVLMPVIMVAVGLFAPSAAAPGGMTPDQARAVLRG